MSESDDLRMYLEVAVRRLGCADRVPPLPEMGASREESDIFAARAIKAPI